MIGIADLVSGKPTVSRFVAPSNPTCQMKFGAKSAVSDSYRRLSPVIYASFIGSAVTDSGGSAPFSLGVCFPHEERIRDMPGKGSAYSVATACRTRS